MAFKMNPKSPALKSTGMYSSPVKQVPGPGPISSPAKQVDKMGQRIIKQGEKAEAAKAEGNDKKATRHTNRAGRMNERDMKKKTKQNLNNSPAKQVKVKDVPKVIKDKVIDVKDKILDTGEKLINKIGNITLVSKERKACKAKGGKFKKGVCYMPNTSPAKQKKVASEPAYKNKLTEIGRKKAKSLKQEAKPLKPLVKSVNTLKDKGVAKASKPTKPTSSKSKWEIHHDLLAMQRATRKKGSTSFSSESQVDNGRNTKNTKVKGTKNVDGSKSLESYKSKGKWAGKGGEAILGKDKWVGTTASIDKDGNKSFEKDIDKDKTGGVWGSGVIGGANKSKRVNIKATSNTDGSKTINRTKTKDLHYVPSKAARDPSIPSRITSSKEKSLSVNVGADGSRTMTRTKKKRRLFGGTKTKTVTITKN